MHDAITTVLVVLVVLAALSLAHDPWSGHRRGHWLPEAWEDDGDDA